MDSLVNSGVCQLGGNRMNGNGNGNNSSDNTTNGQHSMHQTPGDIRHTYTIPGIVQFLQYEWQRFEMCRQQWQVCFHVSQ